MEVAMIDDMLLDICIRETCKVAGRPVNANLLEQVKNTTTALYLARRTKKAPVETPKPALEPKNKDQPVKSTPWRSPKKKSSTKYKKTDD